MAYPVDFDLTIIQGDDFVHEFEFQGEDCSPATLSGTFHSQVKRKDVLLATFTCTYSVNVLTISLSKTVTATLVPLKDIEWDIENHVSGQVQTIMGGKVTVIKDITEVP